MICGSGLAELRAGCGVWAGAAEGLCCGQRARASPGHSLEDLALCSALSEINLILQFCLAKVASAN